MTTPQPKDENPHDAAWALPVTTLKTEGIAKSAMNLNVDGHRLIGLVKGFGQMWQKTYSVRLNGVTATPAEIILAWKKDFGSFWPKENKFFGSLVGIAPGEVAVLNLPGPGGIQGPGHMPMISTGIMVIYADDISFSFMNSEGHIFAGMITFSSFEEEGTPTAQVQLLVRASDPFYELGCRLGIVHKAEDTHWHATLLNLAKHFGATSATVTQVNNLVDPRMQWSEAKNVWQNAAIRTGLYMPIALMKKLVGR